MALDLSRPATPPPAAKSPRAAANDRKREQETAARIESRSQGVNLFGQLACIPMMFLGQVRDAAAIAHHWPNVADETAKLAETNAQVAKIADYLCAVGPLAGIITASIPLALQIMVNHNKLPMSPALMQFGVVDGETLEMQAKAEAARQQAEMQRQMMEQRAAAEKAMREAEQMNRDAA